MGKRPKNASGNVYLQARLEAAERDGRLSSREIASEILGISPYTLQDYELGNVKVVPVDKVVRMADTYRKPELLTGYCKYECPIHGFLPLATEEKNLQGITLRLLKWLNEQDIRMMKDQMIELTEDGTISEDETEQLQKILRHLEGLVEAISELKIVGEKCMARKNRRHEI